MDGQCKWIIPTLFGKGWRFPEFGSLPTPWSFDSECHGTSGVSFHLLMEDQGLVSEVDLSATFDSYDSNQFMFHPQAMSFFQRLCPAPFPPISEPP